MEIDSLLSELIIGDVSTSKDDPVGWIEKEFYIPELMGPMKLAPYHKAVLREAYRKDADGRFIYSVIVWSDVKKSIKSSIAAAVALHRAFHTDYGMVKIIANDLKQADSRVAYYARRAVELNPRLATRVRVINYRMQFDNKAFIEAIPVDPKGEAGGNDDFICFSELWAANQTAAIRMWCYDDQTEILTRDGWKPGVELNMDDTIATIHPETHEMQWERPRGMYRDTYKGEMHLYENMRFSECVTPNHRLYGIFSYNTKDNPYSVRGVMRSDELRASGRGIYFPLTNASGYLSDGCREDIEVPGTKFKASYTLNREDWFEYLGWFASDGRVKHNDHRPCSVYISQSPTAKPDHWQRLYALHDRLFGADKWRLHNHDTDFIVDSSALANLVIEWVGTGTYGKFLSPMVKDADPQYLTRFLHGFVEGDGHVMKHGSVEFPVAHKELADDLCEVAFKLGYTVSIRWQGPRGQNDKGIYRVRICPFRDGYAHEVAKRHGHWQTVDYDGFVWCPSTKNGLLVVRRNGKIYVSGNTESTLSPTKFGYSQRWVETYAGFKGESPLLENLWEAGVNQGQKLDLSFTDDDGTWVDLRDLEVYANHGMLVMWNGTPRCEWQTNESGKKYYEEEARVLRPEEFNRVHRNQWASASAPFIPIEWWDGCKAVLQPLDEFQTVIIGMDAATTNDTFAIVTVSRTKDKVEVREVRVFVPPKNGKLDFAEPEAYLRELCTRYRVAAVVYDPYQLHELCFRLQKEGIAYFEAFQQGAPRLKADKMLYDMIRDGRVLHDDSCPVLREHLLNASATSGENQRTDQMRIVKRVSSGNPIDAVISLSMSAERATFYNIGDF